MSQHNACQKEWYNRTAHTLCSFQNGQTVLIQCQSTRWWDMTGRIIETLPNHQYQIRVDRSGRITLRNHRFLKKLEAPTIPLPISSVFPELLTSTPGRYQKPNTPVPQTMDNGTRSLTHLPSNNITQPHLQKQKPPGHCSDYSHITSQAWRN